ncbi:sulfotransferase family protein [Aspergillus mulundensis]|uniref:Sulfotransferase family protein n=1 Tax=Aspergillus mulundensis TaxID=1810919 RepID=A0A3D8R078_9EURO|nr:hypothetical protein DSM5745_09214 [Aspergillus mulundensis]RDW67348.1 hypothetical protein DSM5745_09214 [Aspergillus mulundensis]
MFLDESQDPNLFVDAYQSSPRGEGADWDLMFRGYDATTDWPAVAFWEPLLKAYPSAKVILTVRDPESWYASVGKTVYDLPVNEDADFKWPKKIMATWNMARTIVKEGELRLYDDKQATLEQYSAHIARVREVVPKDQLLVFEASQGWEPLCRFLGVEVPAGVPYPHLNQGTLFRDRVLKLREMIAEGKGIVDLETRTFQECC